LSYASARRGVRLGEDKEALRGCQALLVTIPSASEKAAEAMTDRVVLVRQSWLPLPEKAVNDRVQTPPPSRLR